MIRLQVKVEPSARRRRRLRTSDVGFKHGGVDVSVEVDGVLEQRRHALELCVVSQNLQGQTESRAWSGGPRVLSGRQGRVVASPAACRARRSESARNC